VKFLGFLGIVVNNFINQILFWVLIAAGWWNAIKSIADKFTELGNTIADFTTDTGDDFADLLDVISKWASDTWDKLYDMGSRYRRIDSKLGNGYVERVYQMGNGRI
jgi:hypothetical protein